MSDLVQEILVAIREIRGEIADGRVLLERNTVTLEEHIRRTEVAEERIKLMEDHVYSCPARMEQLSNETLWKRIRNWGVAVGIVVTLLTQLMPWLKK